MSIFFDKSIQQPVQKVMEGEALPDIPKGGKRLTVYLTPSAALKKYQKEALRDISQQIEGHLLMLARLLAEHEDVRARKWGETPETRQALQAMKAETERMMHQAIGTSFQKRLDSWAGSNARDRQQE